MNKREKDTIPIDKKKERIYSRFRSKYSRAIIQLKDIYIIKEELLRVRCTTNYEVYH